MQVRPAAMPDDASDASDASDTSDTSDTSGGDTRRDAGAGNAPAEPDPAATPGEPGTPAEPGEPGGSGDAPTVRFGPARSRAILAIGAAVVALGFALPDGDPIRRALAAVVAVGLLGYGVRDVVVPVRLAAGPTGIAVIRGFGRFRRVFWFEIDRIRVDDRPRLGLRSQVLEIDVGDALYLFSAGDLGVSCEEAARALLELQPPGFRRSP